MKDSIKADLEALFDKQKSQIEAAAKARAEQETREARAQQEFAQKVAAVIRPVYEEFAALLEQKGHGTSIHVEGGRDDGRYGARVIVQDAITLLISASQAKPMLGGGEQCPKFTVTLDKRTSEVSFHESTILPNKGGQTGGCGGCKLEALTSDLIETALAKTIQKTFR